MLALTISLRLTGYSEVIEPEVSAKSDNLRFTYFRKFTSSVVRRLST